MGLQMLHLSWRFMAWHSPAWLFGDVCSLGSVPSVAVLPVQSLIQGKIMEKSGTHVASANTITTFEYIWIHLACKEQCRNQSNWLAIWRIKAIKVSIWRTLLTDVDDLSWHIQRCTAEKAPEPEPNSSDLDNSPDSEDMLGYLGR